MKNIISFKLLTLAFFLFPSVLLAQQEYKTPSLPENKGVPEEIKVEAPEKKEKPLSGLYTKPMISSLSGIVVRDSKEDFESSPDPFKGLKFTRKTALNQTAEFKDLLGAYLNKPFSNKSLDDMAREIIAYYRLRDYPFVDVLFPEQDLTNGVVQVLVKEAVLGDIEIYGNKHFSKLHILSGLRIKRGDRIFVPEINQDVKWLSQNPFLKVQPLFSPGQFKKETNLELQVDDSLPLRLFAQYNNEGSSTTGRDQFTLGANYANLLGRGHSINYQYTTVEDTIGLRTHAISYLVPFYYGQQLSITSSFTKTQAAQANSLNVTGESDQASLAYSIPFLPRGNFEQSVKLGFDWKRSRNALEFGVIPLSDNTVEIGQLNLSYSAQKPYRFGSNGITFSARVGLDNFFPEQNDEAYNSVRTDARAEYYAYKLDWKHQFKLPWKMLMVNTLSFQYTDQNLLSNEQLSTTGGSGVRGYESGIFSNADKGVISRNEIFSPGFNVTKYSQWRVVGFFDHANFGASSGNITAPAGSLKSTDISSAGLGVRIQLGRQGSFNGSINADYGFQLTDVDKDGKKDDRLHVQVALQY